MYVVRHALLQLTNGSLPWSKRISKLISITARPITCGPTLPPSRNVTPDQGVAGSNPAFPTQKTATSHSKPVGGRLRLVRPVKLGCVTLHPSCQMTLLERRNQLLTGGVVTKNRDQGEKARVKFRYVEFDVEGGSAAIQEGLRNIASALARAPLQRALPATSESAARRNGDTSSAEQLNLIPTGGDVDAVDSSLEEQVQAEEARPRQSRRYAAPVVVNGLDLDGDPSLEEFARQKAPDGHLGRYLLAAVWLKQQKNITEFTADHAFTICKRLGWPVPPKDLGQPLRDLKKQRLMDTGEKPGTYVVNDAGEANVARMSAA